MAKEVMTFFGRLEQISKTDWLLEETASNVLTVWSNDNWEIKAAIPVTRRGKTVGIHYTLQREKK